MTTLILLKTRKASHPADVLPVTISRAGCARDHSCARAGRRGWLCVVDYTVATTQLTRIHERAWFASSCAVRGRGAAARASSFFPAPTRWAVALKFATPWRFSFAAVVIVSVDAQTVRCIQPLKSARARVINILRIFTWVLTGSCALRWRSRRTFGSSESSESSFESALDRSAVFPGLRSAALRSFFPAKIPGGG